MGVLLQSILILIFPSFLQLRNRDAALRSRERKKMYVRDLEMKRVFGRGMQETGASASMLHCREPNSSSQFAKGRQCVWCFFSQAGVCCALVGSLPIQDRLPLPCKHNRFFLDKRIKREEKEGDCQVSVKRDLQQS